jgi:hypothetical protein
MTCHAIVNMLNLDTSRLPNTRLCKLLCLLVSACYCCHLTSQCAAATCSMGMRLANRNHGDSPCVLTWHQLHLKWLRHVQLVLTDTLDVACYSTLWPYSTLWRQACHVGVPHMSVMHYLQNLHRRSHFNFSNPMHPLLRAWQYVATLPVAAALNTTCRVNRSCKQHAANSDTCLCKSKSQKQGLTNSVRTTCHNYHPKLSVRPTSAPLSTEQSHDCVDSHGNSS